MLDRKKRNLYMGLIGASLIGTALVWFLGFGSSGSTTSALPNQSLTPGANQLAPGSTSSTQPTANVSSATGTAQPGLLKDGEFPMPGVFPSMPDYDLSVLESSLYKNLKDYEPLIVEEKDLSREDPFKKVE